MNLLATAVRVLAAQFILVNLAEAIPPTSRSRQGVIQSVNHDNATIKVFTDDAIQRYVVWTNKTSFWANGKKVAPSSFRPGDKVYLSYRSPIFGMPSAIKLRMLDPKRAPSGKK